MDITLTIKVPRHPGRRLRVLVRSPKWVSDQLKLSRHERAKGLQAAAWFQGSLGRVSVGTIALSQVNLELLSHECTHAAFFLCRDNLDEERICILTGELTSKIWTALMKKVAR